MPYISQTDRIYWNIPLQELLRQIQVGISTGELVYMLTKICQAAMQDNHFSDYADIITALECTKLEFYRRQVAPYEDIKIKENGDIE